MTRHVLLRSSAAAAAAVMVNIGAGAGAGLPLVFQSYLRIMRLFQPGLGWAITVSGWFALAWAVIRTVIAVRSTHLSPAPTP
jgi:hypothetical protein